MNKLRIEHGVSRVRRAKLQASIDQSIADDIQAMAEWSNNEPQYVINQLLRFALAQEEDFQKYKSNLAATAARPVGSMKAGTTPLKPATDAASKADANAAHG